MVIDLLTGEKINALPMLEAKEILERLMRRNGFSSKEKEALDIGSVAVGKSISMQPVYEGDGYDDDGNMIYDTWYCPNCDTQYEVDYHDYDYCPRCGQKIDRSQEERL